MCEWLFPEEMRGRPHNVCRKYIIMYLENYNFPVLIMLLLQTWHVQQVKDYNGIKIKIRFKYESTSRTYQ